MNQLDQILTTITRDHLGIETLETRHRDALDFHDVSVGSVRNALKAAFEAGSQSADNALPGLWAALETLADQADEDCPREHRTRHFTTALEEAREQIARAKALAASPPIVAVTVRGGLIEDLDATIPVDVVIEDWDIRDEDTGKRPARDVWQLAGGLSGSKAEMLRRLIAHD